MLKIIEKLKEQKRNHIESFSDHTRSKEKFYITYAHPLTDYDSPSDFVFNFGITINIDRRINEHLLKWGAKKKFTMYLDCNDNSFIRPLETFIKRLPLRESNQSPGTEFRMGYREYRKMGNELIKIANGFPEKKIIFHFIEKECEFNNVLANHFNNVLYREKMLFSDFGHYKGFLVNHYDYENQQN